LRKAFASGNYELVKHLIEVGCDYQQLLSESELTLNERYELVKFADSNLTKEQRAKLNWENIMNHSPVERTLTSEKAAFIGEKVMMKSLEKIGFLFSACFRV
jgi:hypothetical protein